MLRWCLLRLDCDGNSRCTRTWGTDMRHAIFSTQCTWVAAAAAICRAWHYLCLCLLLSSEPLFSVAHHWLPNARESCLSLLFFLATHIPVLSLKLHFSVPLDKFSNLFSVMTLQLVTRQLLVNLALICPLRLSCHSMCSLHFI